MNIMELDIRTILVLLVFGNVASALTIFVYQRRFGFNPPVMHYLAGVLFQSVAWVLLDVQKLVPAFWSVYVGNALLIVGYNMAAIGLSTVGNQDRRIYRTHALVTVLGIVGFVAFSSTPASQTVAASIAALGAFIGLSVWMLRSPHRTDLKLFIGIASIVYCGILVARAVSAMLAGDNFGLMTPAPIQTIAFVPLVLVSSVGAIGFIIISKETIDARLAESEEKYRSLVERANEGIVIAQDSRFVYVNPKMAELLGTSPAMLIGRLFAEYLWPDDRERILTNHHERLAGGTLAESSDIRIIAADGTPRWLSMSSAIIHWDGRPATLNLISDVDERKRSEEQSARLLA
ncbi:MAG: PAS domain S-box protein, partial [Spirochaetales bacterium]|nr:PAS domain S-box protein [Spirochaetales bacterium]